MGKGKLMGLINASLFLLKFQVPLCVIVAWVMGMNMDLDFSILETASLALSIMASSSILQVTPF